MTKFIIFVLFRNELNMCEPQRPTVISSAYKVTSLTESNVTLSYDRNSVDDRLFGSYLRQVLQPTVTLNFTPQECSYTTDVTENVNSSLYLNATPMPPELDFEILLRFSSNIRLEPWAMVLLISVYLVLFSIGFFGNYLVVSTFFKSKSLRTARNIFIVNLAVSDLLLCCITIPFTLVEVFTIRWPLGDSPLPCKLLGLLQGLPVFVSSISIVAIALDRNRVSVVKEFGERE